VTHDWPKAMICLAEDVLVIKSKMEFSKQLMIIDKEILQAMLIYIIVQFNIKLPLE